MIICDSLHSDDSLNMDSLSATIQRCKVKLRLDNPTEGYGNCFPNAIVQQCRRPEIQDWLLENKPWVIVKSQQFLRREVKNFALQCVHKTLFDYKTNYEKVECNSDRTWKDYWIEMGQDGTWVDSFFVQVTSWYLGLDIKILTTSSTPEHPYITITGNINNCSAVSEGPPLLLGNYTNVHYQSLLPLSQNNTVPKFKNKEQKSKSDGSYNEEMSKTGATQDDYIYIHKGEQILFKGLENEKLQCPFCCSAFQRILSHIASKKCNISSLEIDTVEFTSQLKSYREGFRIEVGRRQKQKSRAKLLIERGHEAIREDQNKWKQKSQAFLVTERGKEAIKKDQVDRKGKRSHKERPS